MKWAIIHAYQDIDNTDKEEIHSEHDSYEEATALADNLNTCVSSYEVYYVKNID